MPQLRRLVGYALALGIAGFLLIQIIPVGSFIRVLERRPNPPVSQNFEWDSAEAEQIARAACYDCHSNETAWPWYSHIAPASWLVTRDVNRGRAAMNFSTDPLSDFDAEDLEWHLYNDMPPRIYLPLHPEANLSDEQRALLAASFRALFAEGDEMDGMNMGGG